MSEIKNINLVSESCETSKPHSQTKKRGFNIFQTILTLLIGRGRKGKYLNENLHNCAIKRYISKDVNKIASVFRVLRFDPRHFRFYRLFEYSGIGSYLLYNGKEQLIRSFSNSLKEREFNSLNHITFLWIIFRVASKDEYPAIFTIRNGLNMNPNLLQFLLD